MKRLVWLLLAVLGTAFAQVQPVALPVMPDESCDCCDTRGGCDMPDCAMPAPAPSLAQLAPPAGTVHLSSRRAAKPVRAVAKFFAHFGPTPTRLVASVAPVQSAPAVEVPLFVAHCSYQI